MLYYAIFLIIALFANFLTTSKLDKKVVVAEVSQQKETISAKNNNSQKNTSIDQESSVFSYFTLPQDSLEVQIISN